MQETRPFILELNRLFAKFLHFFILVWKFCSIVGGTKFFSCWWARVAGAKVNGFNGLEIGVVKPERGAFLRRNKAGTEESFEGEPKWLFLVLAAGWVLL